MNTFNGFIFWAFQGLISFIGVSACSILWGIFLEVKELNRMQAESKVVIAEHARRLDIHLQKNNEQDKTLGDHEGRIKVLEHRK